ncbi:hypothetical protein EX30DRAFT_367071 [Ascodesmis nigricans]|uniref:Uncharacterized protein n=1 Tax=Ascodesmis nigricans TaxID=341454 RepID=A0A4S2MJ11_9PEZI|nr:hypothetical protein EX30DRAFT_367071 [Ascodesmis nigricans]
MRINLNAVFTALLMASPVLSHIMNPPPAIFKRDLETLAVPLPPNHHSRLMKRQTGRGGEVVGPRNAPDANDLQEPAPNDVEAFIEKNTFELEAKIQKLVQKITKLGKKRNKKSNLGMKKGLSSGDRKKLNKLKKDLKKKQIELEVFKRAGGQGGEEAGEGEEAGAGEDQGGFGGGMGGEYMGGADGYGEDEQGPPGGEMGGMNRMGPGSDEQPILILSQLSHHCVKVLSDGFLLLFFILGLILISIPPNPPYSLLHPPSLNMRLTTDNLNSVPHRILPHRPNFPRSQIQYQPPCKHPILITMSTISAADTFNHDPSIAAVFEL